MSHWPRALGCLVLATLCCGLALLHGPLQAQELRDPTRAPLPAQVGGGTAEAPPLPVTPGSISVLLREGQPKLVVGTRLFAVGQSVDGYRVERITETEVWLRQGKQLHKLARFGGIERRAAQDCAAPPASAATTAPKAAATRTQPASAPPVRAARPQASAPAGTPSSNAAPCESSPP